MKDSTALQDALLEIGTEEIPTSYIPPVLSFMKSFAEEKLKSKRLKYAAVTCLATPRRLGLLISGIPPKSEPLVEEISGPSLSVSKDAQNQWTQAARGFAQSHNSSPDALQVRMTPKGEYLCITKKHEGQKSEKLIGSLFTEIVPSIPFPKKMVWNKSQFKFARPIRNLVALYGSKTVPMTIAGIKSTNKTFGLFHAASKNIRVHSPAAYLTTLKNHCVLADPETRREAILHSASQLAGRVKGHIKTDESLLEEVVWLVEHPVAVLGSFDPMFLELPQEVLAICMKKHQKFFSISDSKGKLMPYFIAIRNGISENQEMVRKGYEKVLNARLYDARFFFNEDIKKPLEFYIEKSSSILLQDKIGTIGDKIARMKNIAHFIIDSVEKSPPVRCERAVVERAVHLSKFDLTTHLVYELPELQGIIGEIYASRYGENPKVAEAVREHYYPLTNQSELPGTLESSIVAIADKMDTLAGSFLIGLIPSGNTDPYGLRRHSTGILRIVLQTGMDISLRGLIIFALKQFSSGDGKNATQNGDAVVKQIAGFLIERFQLILQDQNCSLDEIYAVTKNSSDKDALDMKINALKKKIEAVHTIRQHPDFDAIALAFKRASNIIKQAKGKGMAFPTETFNASFLKEAAEKDLYTLLMQVSEKTEPWIRQQKYPETLQEWVALRAPLDQFFEKVLVMDPDKNICLNRLTLLFILESLFKQVADFSLIQNHA